MSTTFISSSSSRKPRGLEWRSSAWMATLVLGLSVFSDLFIYSMIIPVIPFRLEALGYSQVSALSSWLIIAFSAGLVVSTIPIAYLTERYRNRKVPMVVGIAVLLGSLVLFMEASAYWLMCVARILQGVSSSLVWTVGMAMLCDTVNVGILGRQMGIALTGLSVGVLIGPSIGGVLYHRFGFRAPFIFGIGITLLDLVTRLFFIERKNALKWGFDPAVLAPAQANALAGEAYELRGRADIIEPQAECDARQEEQVYSGQENTSVAAVPTSAAAGDNQLMIHVVLWRLLQSPRAAAALMITFIYGLTYTSQEPTVPLHLQSIWGLNSSQVGVIFLIASLPTILSSIVAGWVSDRYGVEWITSAGILLSLPWWALVILPTGLDTFVVGYTLENFFSSIVLTPASTELAVVSKGIEGVEYGHMYGAFNLVYGVGSMIGPIIGGQIYDALPVSINYTIICVFFIGCMLIALALSVAFLGDRPLIKRVACMNHANTLRT